MPTERSGDPEGTIVRILVRLGDWVDRHQDLFEISTEQVDAAIPSAVAGRVKEIRFQAGDVATRPPRHRLAIAAPEPRLAASGS